MKLALIGGTGVFSDGLLDNARQAHVETPYGPVTLWEGRIGSSQVVFLPRHGLGHTVPPHRVNYRANIWALNESGIEGILATTAVGSLDPQLLPGSFVSLSSFLDFTSGRESTFFDGIDGPVVHTDMTNPYCASLRTALEEACRSLGEPLVSGCYVCTNGPRFETAAEIRAFRLLGGDVVGMTGVPEVVLARELGLCYAGVSLVTNLAAGLGREQLTHSEHARVVKLAEEQLRAILSLVVEEAENVGCPSCGH